MFYVGNTYRGMTLSSTGGQSAGGFGCIDNYTRMDDESGLDDLEIALSSKSEPVPTKPKDGGSDDEGTNEAVEEDLRFRAYSPPTHMNQNSSNHQFLLSPLLTLSFPSLSRLQNLEVWYSELHLFTILTPELCRHPVPLQEEEKEVEKMLPQRLKKTITDNPKKLANLIDLANLPSPVREFVGQSQISRLGCFFRVWSYIKENNLQ
ncbi:hypothetical protein Gohar_001165, partial [Gossypium harknessii]|nr:hypothetical protein [Gossypium harknessii]